MSKGFNGIPFLKVFIVLEVFPVPEGRWEVEDPGVPEGHLAIREPLVRRVSLDRYGLRLF